MSMSNGFDRFSISSVALGLTAVLGIDLIQLGKTFRKRKNSLVYIMVSALILTILHSSLIFSYNLQDIENEIEKDEETPLDIILDVMISLSWLGMLQLEVWTYITRLSSLGNYMSFDKYVKYIPWIFLMIQIPVAVGIGMEIFWKDICSIYVRVLYILASISLIGFEILLDVFLFQKVCFILEAKRSKKNKLCKIVSWMCGFSISLELGLVISCILFPGIYLCIRPVICNSKILVIIQFYSILLNNEYNEGSFIRDSFQDED
eukprot:NODE_18_length_47517_cov_0.674814.p18 type:complete len:262 gc:universal NODE_18_length_47517_cov_0.674814:37820-37035(-)